MGRNQRLWKHFDRFLPFYLNLSSRLEIWLHGRLLSLVPIPRVCSSCESWDCAGSSQIDHGSRRKNHSHAPSIFFQTVTHSTVGNLDQDCFLTPTPHLPTLPKYSSLSPSFPPIMGLEPLVPASGKELIHTDQVWTWELPNLYGSVPSQYLQIPPHLPG